MPDIKTRAVAEKAVKAIDKSAIAAQRMKNAYVQVKEKAARTASSGEESPEGYASDRVSGSVTAMAYESAHQLDQWGRKEIGTTKENISKVKERFQSEQLTAPLKKKAPEQNGHSLSIEQSQPRIKTFDRGQKVAEQPVKPAEKVAVKRAEGVVKPASKSLKTAGTTGKTTVRTSRQSARAAQQAAQTAAKTTYFTVQATHMRGRSATATAKKAAKSTITAVRAIIAGTKALIAALAAGDQPGV